MADVGKLCRKSGGNALCFKHGGSALVFKAEQVGDVTVRVPWTPQSYTCNTFSTYHEITFSATGSFTQGAGSIVSQTNGGTEVVFTLRVTQGPAVFSISTACSTPCTAHEEDPGVTCNVFANQRGAAPKVKSGVSAPRSESGSSPTVTNVNFDAFRKLTGIT